LNLIKSFLVLLIGKWIFEWQFCPKPNIQIAIRDEIISYSVIFYVSDHIDKLVDQSVANLKQDGKGSLLDSGQVLMVVGDGRKGYAAEAPYDAIHVGAAAPTLPQDLGKGTRQRRHMMLYTWEPQLLHYHKI
jgi:protein-L-isoaspartate O-methyltransferase